MKRTPFPKSTLEQIRAKSAGKPPRKPLARKASLRTAWTKKRGKGKKLTTGQLKKRAWKEFSIFIRTRGADAEGMQHCYTCDVRKFWRQLEAGHLVPGRGNAVLFSEIGVNPQCRKCNGYLRGNIIVYYPKMVKAHGQEVVDTLIAAKDTTHKWEATELLDLFQKYKSLNSQNPLVLNL